MSTSATLEECPVCSSKMPKINGYITWCDKCEWNIQGSGATKKLAMQKFYDILNNLFSRQLFNKIINTKLLVNSVSFARVIALIFSLPILLMHYILLLLLIAVICLVAIVLKSMMSMISFIIIGIIILALIVFFGFKWLDIQKDKRKSINDRILNRQEYQMLYKLVDTICEHCKTKLIDGIMVDEHFNASFSKIFGKSILTIGMPYISVLNDMERVSLISHEVAHNANNDIGWSRMIFKALNVLEEWYYSIRPSEGMIFASGGSSILLFPFLWLLSKTILVYWYIISFFAWRDRQYAEYCADFNAAQIAGSNNTARVLEKQYYAPTYYKSIIKISNYSKSGDILSGFLKRVTNLPEREQQRLKRLMTNDSIRFNASHPPTKFRMKFIAEKDLLCNHLFVDFDFESLNKEIEPLFLKIEDRLKSISRAR